MILAGGFLAYQVLTREHAQDTADAFVQRWSSGNDASAARVTDDPKAAATALKANRAGLDGAKLKATLGDVEESGDSATATLSLRWQVPRIGGWRYDSKLRLRRSGDEWRCAGRRRSCTRSSTPGPGSAPPPWPKRAGRSSTAIGGR